MWPFILLASLSALSMGALNVFGIFGLPNLASAAFNLTTVAVGCLVGWLIDPNFGPDALYGFAIAVVLGGSTSKGRFDQASQLLDWGFANYETVTPSPDTSLITDVAVIGGYKDSFTPKVEAPQAMLLKKGSADKLEQTAELAVDVQAPVAAGERVGTLTFKLDGKIVAECPIVSSEEIKKLDYLEVLRRFLTSFASFTKYSSVNTSCPSTTALV
jgi:hypothetical protein